MSRVGLRIWQWMILAGLLVALVTAIWATARPAGPPPPWNGSWLGPRLPDGSGMALWAFGEDGSFALEGLDGRLALTGSWTAADAQQSLRLEMSPRVQESSVEAGDSANPLLHATTEVVNPWPHGVMTWQVVLETAGLTLRGDHGDVSLRRR